MSTPLLKIFLSHKLADERVARDIGDELTTFSAGKIAVFMSSDIPGGENWLKAIQDKLIDSNLLLLLFTDNKASWEWCMYEAGMFTQLVTQLPGDVQKRVICFHSPDIETPPGPLKHLKPIKGDAPGISKFLKDLYKGNTYASEPIAPGLQDHHIVESAKRIFAHMTKTPRDSQQLLKQIWIKVGDVNEITPDKIPSDAEVLADQASLELFNKKAGTLSWSDLEEKTRSTDQRWIKQLAKAIYQASRKSTTDPVLATLPVKDSSRLYQPILNSVEWERDGSIKFQVLFLEEVTWRLRDIPDNLAVLHTAQSMALRFRFEVLRKYASLRQDGKRSLSDTLLELREVITSIEHEADSRGLFEEHKLLTVFKPDQRPELKYMYDDWYAIRRTLQEAVQQSEVDTVKRCLSSLEHHNSVFIPMATQRYEELMTEVLRDDRSLYTEERLVKFSSRRLSKKSQVNSPPLSKKNSGTKSSKSRKREKERHVSE